MNYRRIPVNGTFELTGKCNLACKMCLMRVDSNRMKELGLHERTAKEWIDLARQASQAGTVSLLLTGGEVMSRKDFIEIYKGIYEIGFLLTLYTNATMVTDEIMEVLRKYPPNKIGVTMYGASNETYEKVCGIKNGYDRFIDGVAKLKTLPSLLDIRTTIIQDNYCDLEAIEEYAYSTAGKDHFHISRQVTNVIRGGIAHPKECRLSPEENVERAYGFIFKLRDQLANLDLSHIVDGYNVKRHSIPQEGKYLFAQCGAGISEYAISWSGRMYACEMLSEGYTEPFQDGFVEAWEKLPMQYPKARNIEQCEKCQVSMFCEACPAFRLSETGDYFGIPEYSCKEAKYIDHTLREIGMIQSIIDEKGE